MIRNLTIGSASVAAVLLAVASFAAETDPVLPPPVFHHVHLNSPSPKATIDEYIATFPSNTRASLAGFEGFKTSNNIYFLVNKVKTAPPVALPDKVTAKTPQTAMWHMVFPVTSLRDKLAEFHKDPKMAARILPLYTGPDGKFVEMSGDATPGFLTVPQIEEAKAKGVKPTGEGGYITWAGPDGVTLESQNGGPGTERLSSFVLFQDQPYCAVLWYQKHLNAPPPAAGRGGKKQAPAPEVVRTEENCKVAPGTEMTYVSTYKRGHSRIPPMMGVAFGEPPLRWYMNQESKPLSPMRGGPVDHFGLSVQNLDPWIAKLQKEGVKFLEGPKPYKVGTMRAIMIEGPSKEAIELIEVKN